MECKKFDYKDYKNCTLYVGNYRYNKQCMAIGLLDKNGDIIDYCTVNKTDYMYYPDTATIRNYSETAGITKILKKLGIIEQIYSSVKAHQFANKSETIDYCQINIEKIKEYSKEFNYEWEI